MTDDRILEKAVKRYEESATRKKDVKDWVRRYAEEAE